MTTNDKAPLWDGALPEQLTGDAGSADAVPKYTTAPTPSLPQNRCARLVTWLRCQVCQRGYFTTGAPGAHPCPACAGGRLHPVALWDLAHEGAPAAMVRCGEV